MEAQRLLRGRRYGAGLMGPLSGVRVIELVGLGPGAFCGMLLADQGADVLRVVRPSTGGGERDNRNPMDRGKRSAEIDLKHPEGVALLVELCERADALIEVFRPGVAERLGIGPAACRERNPRLVYGRLTGWGQEGPLADAAGHDLTYLALSGALEPLGRAGSPPTPPINLLADFAGGGMLLAYGITCALLEAKSSGEGQVVDAAMVDGAATLFAPFFAAAALGAWGPRGTNELDTGAPYYEVYATSDARWVAVAAIEDRFWDELLTRLGLTGDPALASRHDRGRWPAMKERLAAVFASRTRAEWCELLEGSDACFAPVLEPGEAALHPHNCARDAFVTLSGFAQPAPAPRFSRTTPEVPVEPTAAAVDGPEALRAWGVEARHG